MDSIPVVSVIMPNFNGANLISQSIHSVLIQSFNNLELLIVDDGSDDESVQIIKGVKDKRIHLLQQEHLGVCAARNYAISQARGEFIAFLDSDDTWTQDFLQKLITVLKENSDAALAYCGWQNVGLEGGKGEPFIPPDYETPDKLPLWIQNCRWPIHSALTRSRVIQSIGGFDSRFSTSEDFLLWLRIVAHNKIVRVPEVLAYYYHHEGPRATDDQVRMGFNHLSAQWSFLNENPKIRKKLGWKKVRELTYGVLLKRGYICYWQGDLLCARSIFRRVMQAGYGGVIDWKYMLPALLPLTLQHWLINIKNKYIR